MRAVPPMLMARLLVGAIGVSPATAFAGTGDLDRLVQAYPQFLASHDADSITFRDGTRMPIGQLGRTFEDRLERSTIADQMSLPYRMGEPKGPPGKEEDPGRFRSQAFFDKMYGDCFKGETQKKLVNVLWLPSVRHQVLRVTSVNGVAEHLKKVSDELDKLPADLKIYATPSAGTYNCRHVAAPDIPSMHGWGAAIDLNTKYSDYWGWSKGKPYRNRIPYAIVEVFERNGFIWGGKWDHYDTMHFEYRPELLPQQ